MVEAMDDFVRKSIAFIVRTGRGRTQELLVYTWLDAPDEPWRLPGGTLLEEELPETGLLRELHEEVGEFRYKIVRKLGMQRYFNPFIGRHVERHDFLVEIEDAVPDTFYHADSDIPAGEPNVLQFEWIAHGQVNAMHAEHRAAVNAAYVPEFFNSNHLFQKTGGE